MQGATVVLTGLTGSHQAHSLVEMRELKWETVNLWNDNMRQINRFLIYHTLQRNKIIPWDREASRFAFINGPGFQWWGCHGGEIERWEAEIWSGSQRTYRLSKGFLSSRKDSYGMKCNMNHYHPILSLRVLALYSIVLMSNRHSCHCFRDYHYCRYIDYLAVFLFVWWSTRNGMTMTDCPMRIS